MKQKKKQKDKIIAVPENKYLVWVMFGSFLVCVFFASSFKIGGDDDFFWHLATGRFIVENKYVPDSDPFGYATQGNQWIPFEWGWDVLAYSLFSVGGYSAILVFRSVIICLIFYLYILLFRKFNINPILSILLLFVLLIGSMDRLTPRPHLITYLFTVILLYLLFTFKYIDKEKDLKKLYILPLLFIIWCNFHMGVMIGITILLIFTFSEMLIYYKPSLSKKSELKPLDKEVIKRLIIIMIVCLLALLINPHWHQTYLYAYSHSQMKMLEKIHEWQNPFSGKIDYNFIVTIYKVLLFSGFVVLIYAFKKKELIHALMYIVFAVYSIRAIRFTVDYEIVIIFFIALSLQYFTGKFLQSNTAVSKAVNSNLLKGLFVVLFLYLTIQIQSDGIYHTIKYYRLTGYNIDENYSPVHVFNFIKDSGIKGVPFNSFECGGYFIWTLGDQKNFIDSRNLNDNIFDEYSRIYSMKQGFENDLERLNIDYFIYFDPELFLNPLKMKNTINGFLFKNKMWKLVYWDDRSLLFVKEVPKYAEVIEKYNYSVLNPYDMYYNKEVFESNIKNNPDTAKKELDRKASMEPEGFFYRNMAALMTKYLKPG